MSAWQEPDRLDELPPDDRYCDLVLNGGVASGVVYPWTLIELARHYRFRRIGANSVGAIAGALAAAAEFGRCTGQSEAFEPLRRAPIELAASDATGKPLMLRLFQPPAPLQRAFELLLLWAGEAGGRLGLWGKLARSYWRYDGDLACGLAFGLALVAPLTGSAPLAFLLGVLALLLLLALPALALWRDLRRLRNNHFGLCRGSMAPEVAPDASAALVEWLHEGVQRSAGRNRDAPPLSFADLQRCPRHGQVGSAARPGLELFFFTSHIGLGRALRLPLDDPNTRLFFDPEVWAGFFPPTLMKALLAASKPYAPASDSDPSVEEVATQGLASLRELPGLDMPIAVAARLSLTFPLLFSLLPVWSIDFEAPKRERTLRRSWLCDGGLCSNFPVHLFDSAHPRWPTFALLLDERLKTFPRQRFWRAGLHLQGRGDNWLRGVPTDLAGGGLSPLRQLIGLAMGMVFTMKDWNDRMAARLPHTRQRVMRYRLLPREGQLRVDMPGTRILRMAHVYGSAAGHALVKDFLPTAAGPSRSWREHLYVRALVELRALRRHLRGYTAATLSAAPDSLPLDAVLAAAQQARPLGPAQPQPPDPAGEPLSATQLQALRTAVQAVQQLDQALEACERDFGPYQGSPAPELRLRTPL